MRGGRRECYLGVDGGERYFQRTFSRGCFPSGLVVEGFFRVRVGI